MSGLLFLLDVAGMVMIALWLWGVERPTDGWRVRLFDMRDQDSKAPAGARAAPRWRNVEPGTETPPPQPRTGVNGISPRPSSRQPRWRRSV